MQLCRTITLQHPSSLERCEHDFKVTPRNRKISCDLDKGYIRKVLPSEIPSTGWILPEHGVINSNKPGKIRRVSNAKSRYKVDCLNDMLSSRPDLLSNLPAVICRFRARTQIPNQRRHRMDVYSSICSARRSNFAPISVGNHQTRVP